MVGRHSGCRDLNPEPLAPHAKTESLRDPVIKGIKGASNAAYERLKRMIL
jgi:hypothetical protein